MCGISGLIFRKGAADASATIVKMTDALRHRGPDGEGYCVSNGSRVTPCSRTPAEAQNAGIAHYFPQMPVDAAGPCTLTFGHRRLSIIDLKETGRQPMCDTTGSCWITYNGELYNYVELREELKQHGHEFISESDTEVLLAAYRQWGYECVNRFNGMWAFVIYDTKKNVCFASRDRLGVKPFYYHDESTLFAFASEQKALVKGLSLHAVPREETVRTYLLNAALEQEEDNFFEGIKELWPGHNLVYDLSSHTYRTFRYFHLKECVTAANDDLSETELIKKIHSAVEDAVRLRMRSDVEVGTCLSGGIDSSAIALLMSRYTPKPVSCFTAVFPGQPFNEEQYADLVAGSINCAHHKIRPAFEGFVSEVDELVYSQDVPIWDSSTYAQYKVMQLAKNNGIKVVLDGQGADELFAGYHHHFIAKWNGMLRRGNIAGLLGDIMASGKTFSHPLAFYVRHGLIGKPSDGHSDIFTSGFLKGGKPQREKFLSDVNEQLLDDIYRTRLKSFLKCEDRCGMWHGVESRTPFSDDTGLFTLMFSFNGSKKLKRGVSKHLLREALKPLLPAGIYTRYDKKGFETPMQDWVQGLRPQMVKNISEAGFPFLKENALKKLMAENPEHNRLLFRLFILSRWTAVFA
jgi:asparagine synthase (glutamine-hydrolysing)